MVCIEYWNYCDTLDVSFLLPGGFGGLRGAKQAGRRTNSATSLELPFKESLWTLDLSFSFSVEAIVAACAAIEQVLCDEAAVNLG